ncbi:hypothetical protein GCM10010406_09390 [Streptomyces thermolineatus]|uniref:Uncharacterized protein n=1 Tax=Streptomyces thermolineatus TaxID=44033 RepID=A0ABN3L4P7_9ACTN
MTTGHGRLGRCRGTGGPTGPSGHRQAQRATLREGLRHMDDIFGEIFEEAVEEVVEETAEAVGGEFAESIVEGFFD